MNRSTEPDFDPRIAAWLADDPTLAPRNALETVLAAYPSIAQGRAPLRRLAGLRPRLLALNPSLRLAAAAAVVLLIVGTALAVVSRAPAVGVNPSPSHSAVPSPSAAAIWDPMMLQASWTSVGTRHTPYRNGNHTLDTVHRVDIVIDASEVRWEARTTDVLSSKSIVRPDMIEFRMVPSSPPEWNCQIGDVGTYRFGLASGDQSLTLTLVSDVCAARAAVLTGDWLRTDMGDLSRGRHVPPLFRPFGDAGGQFSYTVPSGWSDQWECADCLTLANDATSGGINLYSNVVPLSLGSSCEKATAGVSSTPTDIARWLTTLPGLVATTPKAVSVGSLSGTMIEMSAGPDSATVYCQFLIDGSGSFTLADPQVPDLPLSIHSVGNGMSRWILLDRGDGLTLLVDLEGYDKTSWDAFLVAAMPVVNTFTFVH